MIPKEITARGSTKCRSCDSLRLNSILDMGLQPIPSEYGSTPDEVIESFPLHLKICKECSLGQLAEYVLPERIFHKNYPYLSSTSNTWLQHASDYTQKILSFLELKPDSWVLEIASNDGYLLKNFKERGIDVLGVEPAINVANIAKARGINTISKFFGSEVANEILEKKGFPDLIIANNVFAHTPDMQDFMRGLAILCGNNTTITIENPSFTTLLKEALFDTIYHEHYSYISAHTVKHIAERNDLQLVKIDTIATHGGSNRYYLRRESTAHRSVDDILKREIEDGLFCEATWISFQQKAQLTISNLKSWLLQKKVEKARVVAYGAAHKGNTFLNSAGIDSSLISYVLDASPEKLNKFLPGSRIPVLGPEELINIKPTDVLILPWNLKDEISQIIRKTSPNSRIWIAQPLIEEVTR